MSSSFGLTRMKSTWLMTLKDDNRNYLINEEIKKNMIRKSIYMMKEEDYVKKKK